MADPGVVEKRGGGGQKASRVWGPQKGEAVASKAGNVYVYIGNLMIKRVRFIFMIMIFLPILKRETFSDIENRISNWYCCHIKFIYG